VILLAISMGNEVTFFILAGTAIGGAVLMIARRKAWNSFVFFVLTLLATSGIFLQIRAPLLFGAHLVAIACLLAGLILFVVEVGKLDVFVATGDHAWAARFAAITVLVALALQLVLLNLQERWMPGESLTVLLPQTPTNPARRTIELLKDLYRYDLLALALMIFIFLLTALGTRTRSRKRA
jgi:NADH:ubiquinone oxidoreductase subunit 6 (subunit J)